MTVFWLASGAVAGSAAADSSEGDARLERGRELFRLSCASCHGPEGRGEGPVGRALREPLRPLAPGSYRLDADRDGRAGTRADLELVLVNGAPTYGGSRLMAASPWLTEAPDDLAALLAHLEALGSR